MASSNAYICRRYPVKEKVRVPFSQPLLAAIKALKGECSRAAMVGDTLADIQCARAAGFTAIAVSYGFSDLSVFALGADTVIDDFVELASVLRKAS